MIFGFLAVGHCDFRLSTRLQDAHLKKDLSRREFCNAVPACWRAGGCAFDFLEPEHYSLPGK